MTNKLALRIKELRESCGWSQEVLAIKLGTTRQSISNWEMGKRTPDPETLEAIADIFNVDMDYLYGRTDKTTYIAKRDYKLILSKEEQDLLINYNKANLYGKKIILDTSSNISKAYSKPSREKMINYLRETSIAAYKDEVKNPFKMSDEELEEEYNNLRKDFGDD